MQRQRKALDEDMQLLQMQVYSYDTDFLAERQSREKLMRDYQKLQHQLQEKEDQLNRFHDYFNTNKSVQDKLTTDNNQLRQQINQWTHECEQLRRSQQQKEDKQLSNGQESELPQLEAPQDNQPPQKGGHNSSVLVNNASQNKGSDPGLLG